MSFIFIRHGESEGNVLKLCQGQQDFSLSNLGREQALNAAKQLGSAVAGQSIALYASDLSRAFMTAKIIAHHLGIDRIVTSRRLRERDWGKLSGGPNIPMFEYEKLEVTGQVIPTEHEVEPLPQFVERIKTILSDVIAENLDSKIPVIVGHGRFFRTLCSVLEIETVEQIGNCMPVKLVNDKGQWRVASL